MRVCVFVSTRACACTPARVCTRADDARTHARRLADGPRARAQRRTASRRPSTSSTSPAGRHPTRNESQARVAQRRCRCTTCRSSRRGRPPARRRPSGAVAAIVGAAAIAPRRALDGCTLVRVRYLRRRTRRQNGRAPTRAEAGRAHSHNIVGHCIAVASLACTHGTAHMHPTRTEKTQSCALCCTRCTWSFKTDARSLDSRACPRMRSTTTGVFGASLS